MNVMAAPNRSRITARTTAVEQVEGQPKWYFSVDVLEAEAVEGGLFVHAGEAARAFAVGEPPDLREGDVFSAEVEFLGGPGGGELQLLTVEDVQREGAGPGDDAGREDRGDDAGPPGTAGT